YRPRRSRQGGVPTMKPSQVYRKAAELVASRKSDPSCLAIDEVCGKRFNRKLTRHAKKYARLFAPLPDKEWRYTTWGHEWDDRPLIVRRCRVLALLLMSEIAKDEERK